MKINVKDICIGAVSFFVGSVVTGLIVYKKSEKKWKKISDEEVESVKKMYDENNSLKEPGHVPGMALLKKPIDEFEKFNDEPYEDILNSFYNGEEISSSNEQGIVVDDEFVDRIYKETLQELSELDDHDELEEEEDEDESIDIDDFEEEEDGIVLEPIKRRGLKNIEIIDASQYGDFDDYSLLSMTYYEGDYTLAIDGEEPLSDPISYVGDCLYDIKGEDVIYVRNNNLMCDCEIVRTKGCYSD